MIVIRIVRLAVATAAVAGSLALARTSAAQPTADAADQAAQLFDRGNALYKEGHWADAEAQFQKAWNLRKSFDLAANLGDCEIEVGQNREAAEHLAYAVKEFPLSGKPSLRERLQQRFALARSRVSALKVRVSVPGAEVTVDDRAVGVAPLADEVFVEPGAHVVEARLGDYETGQASVDVAQGAGRDVTITLLKRAASLPVATGPSKAIVIGGGVVTGVGIVLGAVLAVVSDAKGNSAQTTRAGLVTSNGTAACTGLNVPASCSALQNDIRAKNAFGSTAAWSFIGAGTVGVATLIYALAAPRTARTGGVIVAPAVTVGGGGLTIVGAW